MNLIQAARVMTVNYRLRIDSRDAYALVLCRGTGGRCGQYHFRSTLVILAPPKTLLELQTDSDRGEVQVLNLDPSLISEEALIQELPAFVTDVDLNTQDYILSSMALLESMAVGNQHVSAAKAVLTAISLSLRMKSIQRSQDKSSGSHSHQLVEQAREIIRREYANPLTLQAIADELFVNPCYLSTIFHQDTQMTFRAYLRQVRLRHAKRLLEESNHLITDIAMQTGFNSTAYLISIFRQEFGMTPSAYRAQFRRAGST